MLRGFTQTPMFKFSWNFLTTRKTNSIWAATMPEEVKHYEEKYAQNKVFVEILICIRLIIYNSATHSRHTNAEWCINGKPLTKSMTPYAWIFWVAELWSQEVNLKHPAIVSLQRLVSLTSINKSTSSRASKCMCARAHVTWWIANETVAKLALQWFSNDQNLLLDVQTMCKRKGKKKKHINNKYFSIKKYETNALKQKHPCICKFSDKYFPFQNGYRISGT